MPFFKGEVKESPRKEFSTGTTTANWSRYASMNGSPSSRSRTIRASASGGVNSLICGSQSFSTSAPIPSSAATSPSTTTSGWWSVIRSGPEQAIAAQWLQLQGIPDPAKTRELQSRRSGGEAIGSAELGRRRPTSRGTTRTARDAHRCHEQSAAGRRSNALSALSRLVAKLCPSEPVSGTLQHRSDRTFGARYSLVRSLPYWAQVLRAGSWARPALRGPCWSLASLRAFTISRCSPRASK